MARFFLALFLLSAHTTALKPHIAQKRPNLSQMKIKVSETSRTAEPHIAVNSQQKPMSDFAFGAIAVAAPFIFSPDIACASEYSWILPFSYILDPVLNLGSFAMLLRVVMSWYPEIQITKMPYLLVTFPTEPLLRPTRALIPPAFGVDISPVVWIGLLSFIREILFGQQGLFYMIQ